MTGSILREDNTTKAAHNLQPDSTKSTADKIKHNVQDSLDTAASHLPNNSKARDVGNSDAANPLNDHGRAGTGVLGDSMKPSGEQSITEKIGVSLNQGASHAEPNSSKPVGRDLKDTITPGADSSLTPHAHATHPVGGQGTGVMESIGNAMHNAAESIKGAVGGGADGAKTGASTHN